MTDVTGFGGSVTSILHNTAGLLTDYNFSNSITTQIRYTLRNLTDTIKAGQLPSWSVLNLKYDYYDRGNTKTITDYLDSTKNQSFIYDELNRLTDFNGLWGAGSYSYDSTGNRKSKTLAGVTTTYNYSTSTNRLDYLSGGESLTFSYNGYGSLTGTSCSGGNTLTYDMLNNLKEYKYGSNVLASFAYDGDGMRVSKTTWKTIVYHYDKDGRTLSETDSNGNLIADNIYLNGKLVAKAEPSALYFYHTDPAGTALAMTDVNKNVVWKTDYKPFGEEQSITGTIENNEKFAGKEKDKETGLYYFGARYLGPKIGRFITVDPIGPVNSRTGKVDEKFLLNPQKFNRYAYTLNNPYRYVDPLGLTEEAAMAVYGETSSLYPQQLKKGKIYNSKTWDTESYKQLQEARKSIADIYERNKRMYTKKPSGNNKIEQKTWQDSEAAAKQAESFDLPSNVKNFLVIVKVLAPNYTGVNGYKYI